MAPRRKKTRSRRRKTFSLLNALESYTYAAIITQNVAGNSPWGLLTGKTDLGYTATGNPAFETYAGSGMQQIGAGEISLGDIISEPGQALGVMAMNFQSNLIPMAVQAATVGFGFRIGRRLLRRPLSSINRNLVKPMLGAGIRI
jgi:hypothetical protein